MIEKTMAVLLSGLALVGQSVVEGPKKIFKPSLEGHKVRVEMTVVPFDAKKHKITKRQLENGSGELTEVDGRCARGTDFGLPKREITDVRIVLDGREFKLPPKLFRDCFEPGQSEQSIRAVLTEDRSALIVVMSGGDGAGGYSVGWVIRMDGNHTRIMDMMISLDPERFDV